VLAGIVAIRAVAAVVGVLLILAGSALVPVVFAER
jgi:hypothetical protein